MSSFIENQHITSNNIIKQTIKRKIVKIINNNTELYDFKKDIIDEINSTSDHIFKNADITRLEEFYKEIFIEELTEYFYEKCITTLIIPNVNLITNLNESENEILYIIINNNIVNNNIQYGIISDLKNSTINYYTFSESQLNQVQNTFNEEEFIILIDNKFIFIIKLDFIKEEFVNSCNLYVKK